MDKLDDIIPLITAYQPALVALIILCLAVLIQSFLAGILGLGKSDEEPGKPLKGTHNDLSFRILRTYANSTENLSMFGLTVFLAIVAGVSPAWVNWLAGVHVVIRLLYWAIYYSGIGKVAGGPRTMAYASGLLANLSLPL